MSINDTVKDVAKKVSSWLGEQEGRWAEKEDSTHEVQEALSFTPSMLFQMMPYQYYDEKTQLFINKGSHGFGFLLEPSVGADEALVQSMADLIKNKITDEVEVQWCLLGHPWVGSTLEAAFETQKRAGGIFEELSRRAMDYHKKAALQGYKNKRNIPAVLRDYQCYFWVSQKNTHDVDLFLSVRDEIEAELKVSRLYFTRITLDRFLALLHALTSPNLHKLHFPEVTHNPLETLDKQVLNLGTSFTVEPEHIDIQYQHETEFFTTRAVSLSVNKFPDRFALWMTPDLFCNLFRSEKGITCPFLMTLHARLIPQSQAKQLAGRKFFSLDKRARAPYAKFVTGTVEGAHEWKHLRDQLADDSIRLCETFFNITLFSDPKTSKEEVAKAFSTFRYNGIELYVTRYTQMQNYLSCLPFFNSEGLFNDLKRFGKVSKMTHWNVANLIPIVADFKGTNQGILLPSFRNQLSFIDNFDDHALPITNYNATIIASSGSGKSVLSQNIIMHALGRGDLVFVMDVGGSYKHLCQTLGGTYIDASTLKLNPFTLFDFEDSSNDAGGNRIDNREIIRNLLAIMASPEHPIVQVQMDWLLEAAQTVWREKKQDASIDDIVRFLKDLYDSQSQHHDMRLHDLILHLKKYTTGDLYGHIFNGKAPLLTDQSFVVLELGALDNQPDLLKIVMFVMIVIIQGQFYHSDRARRKLCIIDEAWRWLAEGENKIAAKFIEMGFRTARKHKGAFIVIAQMLDDLNKSVQGKAIKSSSDIQFILRQGDFKKYVKEHPEEFDTLQETLISGFGEAKNNGYSEMMVRIGTIYSFHRLFLDPFSKVLFSSDAKEVTAIQKCLDKGMILKDAIAHVADHYYGDET